MNLKRLATETQNPATKNLDVFSTLEIVAAIQREDEKIAAAVRPVLPIIAQAVDQIVDSIRSGGRLFYIGAGTSGRLGILDAVECPPTFNTAPELIQGLIAGGQQAMFHAVEGAEDDLLQAEADLRQRKLQAPDVVVGLAASGRTPYVMGGLKYAQDIGCTTLAVVCVPEAELSRFSGLTINVVVGPEVITGSTRMKAGTAQKMVLNMLSTAAMVKLGKTYGNLMVDVRPTNAKLVARVHRMVKETTCSVDKDVTNALELSGGSAKIAIVMLLAGLSAERAAELIEQSRGSVRHALKTVERNRVNGTH